MDADDVHHLTSTPSLTEKNSAYQLNKISLLSPQYKNRKKVKVDGVVKRKLYFFPSLRFFPPNIKQKTKNIKKVIK